MKLRVVLALCGLSALLLFPAVYAQEEKKEAPKGPQMDEVSRKLVQNWDKSTYHLGRLGVKKASCKSKFNMSQMGQEITANFTYKWDGEKGRLDCDNPQLSPMLGRFGFLKGFDADLKHEPLETKLGTAKCTAKATETGHVVAVDGKTKAGFKSLTFDSDGALTQLVMEQAGQMGPQKIMMKLTHTKVEDKYLVSSHSADVDGARGLVSVTVKFTYAKVGDYQVKQKQATDISMGGMAMVSHTLENSDWKFNDDVDAAPAAKPADPGKSDEK